MNYRFLIPLLLSALSLSAVAQEEAVAPTANLETIEVEEADLAGTETATDTAADEVITREKLDEENAQDLEDAFRHSPDVNVGGGQEAAQKIYVRGLEDTNLNVTVDGARQSGYVFHHHGRVAVDLELIKQVDVVAGTGSALSGAGALGGAVRFETKDVEDLLRPGSTYGAFIKGRYETNDDEKGVSLGLFSKPTERFGILLYGTLAESDDYKTGSGARQAYTAAKPKSYLGKISYRPGDHQKLTLTTLAREDNATRTLRAHMGASTGGARPNTPRDEKFRNETHTLRYDLTPSHLLNLRAEAYSTKTELSQGLNGNVSAGESRTLGADVRNEFKFTDLSVTVGTDFSREKGQATRDTITASETLNVYGVYTQANYQLSRLWTVSAGARFDDYRLTDVASQKINDSRVSPNVGVRYALTSEQSLFANHSQAFRGPTPIEAYILAGAVGSASNTNVRGTRAETNEIGWEQKKEILSAKISAYHTKLNHPLDSVLVANIATRQNVPDITSQGFIFAVGSVLKNWELSASYTTVRLSFGDEPIGYSGGTSFARGAPTGDRANARIGYRFTDLNLLAGFSSLVVADLDRLPAGQQEQPGYDVHDFNLSWLPNDRVQVNFTVQNIFDKNYVAQGTPYVGVAGVTSVFEPGRDFRLSASYLF